MTIGYLNSADAKRTVHREGCRHPFKHKDRERRVLDIRSETFSAVVRQIEDGLIPFRSEAGFNDLTMKVTFNDEAFELAVIEYLGDLLANQYKRLAVPVVKCSACW